jgi:inosose dehydratase
MPSRDTLAVTVTCAPCCWGVDDVTNPHLPPWERVLDEASAAGFGGLELGPYGYMPLDVARVGAALDARGLRIVAGTIFDDLVRPANRENLLRQTDEICAFITALPRPRPHPGQRFPAPYLTVMDWGHDERDYAAGHSARAPRLDAEAWAGMVANIRAIAALAQGRYGVRAVIHPHAGGYIEFEDELDRIAADLAPALAGLCLDTGHLDYSGMDPVATVRRYADRLDYIHFKDIDPAVYADVIGRRIRFFEACAEGVMCPIGRGRIDYPGLRALLGDIGYGGYITIEQERDPRNAAGSLADLTASRDYLRRTGF